MAVVVESSIDVLRERLADRDDVPKEFPTATGKPEVQFIEYEKNWKHQTWQTEKSNGVLYPSDDSYTPYLESV